MREIVSLALEELIKICEFRKQLIVESNNIIFFNQEIRNQLLRELSLIECDFFSIKTTFERYIRSNILIPVEHNYKRIERVIDHLNEVIKHPLVRSDIKAFFVEIKNKFEFILSLFFQKSYITI